MGTGIIEIDTGGDPPPTPEQRLRKLWSDNLSTYVGQEDPERFPFRRHTRKQLVAELAKRGVHVSPQAVSQWLHGQTSPKPHHQAAIAKVIGIPAAMLFPVEGAAA